MWITLRRAENFALILTDWTENDNLRGEYSTLYREVEEDIAWARIALGQQPDAVNLWIGNARSITSLHRDNYENVYCQIVGRKHFVLLPSVETACINEKPLTAATYAQKTPMASVSDFDHDRVPALPLTSRDARLWTLATEPIGRSCKTSQRKRFLVPHGTPTSPTGIAAGTLISASPFGLI